MQDGTTADMIWNVAELIEFISRSITLEPGDIIATGTPSGVGVFRDPPVFLLPGDRARCEIDGIGWVENPIVDWSDEDDEDDDDIESLGSTATNSTSSSGDTDPCSPWSSPRPGPGWTCARCRCRPSASTTS